MVKAFIHRFFPKTQTTQPQSLSKSKDLITFVSIWGILRIITSIWVALVSSLAPLTALESSIRLWPLSSPWMEWLTRVIVSPWLRWDALWYVRIVSQGYQSGNGTTAFHPLYAWLATPLSRIGFNPGFSLLVVSSVCTLLLLYYLKRLGELDLSREDSQNSVLLFFFFPLSFILFAPYTESLFLLCSVICIYYARRRKWWMAGLMGALASLTRQQGVFLVIPMIWELWEENKQSIRSLVTHWRKLIYIALCPGGLLFWIFYRWIILKDLNPDFTNFNSLIYSLFISSSQREIVPAAKFVWPWQAMWNALGKAWLKPDVDILTNLVFGFVFLLLCLLAWRKMCISYKLYTLVIILVSLSDQTGINHPYMGLPRHLYLAFPVFIGISAMVKRPWQRLLWSGIGLMGILFLLFQYSLESWVP